MIFIITISKILKLRREFIQRENKFPYKIKISRVAFNNLYEELQYEYIKADSKNKKKKSVFQEICDYAMIFSMKIEIVDLPNEQIVFCYR